MSEAKILHVDNGKISPVCVGCGFYRTIDAPPKKHKLSGTCPKCGAITSFEINRRKSLRKPYLERMYIGKKQVLIKDLSLGGLSFMGAKLNIPLVANVINIILPLTMRRGDEIYEPLAVKIVSRKGGVYCVEFLNLKKESRAMQRIYSWLREK